MNFKFFKWALGVLGFSTVATSCEVIDDIGRGPVAMYGCPSADYVFNVEIEDIENGRPIEGIRVSAVERGEREHWDESGNYYTVPYIDTLAVGRTSDIGRVTLSYNVFPRDKHEIVADDIDGAENGDYSSTSVEIDINKESYEEPGEYGWYWGTAAADVTIKLDKKTSDE